MEINNTIGWLNKIEKKVIVARQLKRLSSIIIKYDKLRR